MERIAAAIIVLSLTTACQTTPPSQPMEDPPAEDLAVAPRPPVAVEAPPPPAAEDEAERRLADRVLRSRLEAQERDALARVLLDEARLSRREGRLDEARALLRRALGTEASPALREEASAALAAIEAERTPATVSRPAVHPDLQRRRSISEIHSLLEEGRTRTARGDFDGAFESLDQAEAILGRLPYDEPRDVLEPRIGDLRRTNPASRAEEEAIEAQWRRGGCSGSGGCGQH